MVAVVAGQGLGLYNNSLTGLNGQSSALGQGNNRVFINHNTGNLIIQHYTDELASKGLNTSLLQTYNSQGQSNDPRNQPWLLGLNRYISELPEVPNEAGSLLVKRNGDGSESIYRYSEQHKAYITADGDGAHDLFRYDAATKSWTWEEGSSRVKEFYNGTGQLTALEDKAGNRTQLTYHNNQLIKLEDASGQITHLSYEGQKLTAIQIEYTGDNSQQIKRTLAQYGYDDLGRLGTVITDLTPDDNSVEDGAIYQTTYSYEGDSQRIKQITNSDGTQLTFTYQQVGDKYVISQYRDATGIGADYHYDADNRTTQVTDALGQQTDYQFDDLGRIVKVLTPAIDGQRTTLQYSYDAQDNIVEVIDGLGNKVTREFDVMGNLVYEFDANHHIKHFQYNDQQQLVAEATWQLERAPLNDNERKAIPENVVAKCYVYDEQGFKRFVISPEGNITGLNYDAYGQLVETYQVNGILYPKNKLVLRQGESAAQPTLTELNALVSSEQAEKVMQTTSLYDSRGLVGKVIQHDGQGNTQETAFQYDAFGRLLRKIDAVGVAETINYDGLGRVLSKTNKAGQTTVFRYDDQQHTVATTFSNGLVKTELFDAAGRLLSRTEKATDTTATNRVRFFYDKAGRQVASEDKTGSRSYTLFDARNRKVASIDSVGALTEFRYDANGQLIESIQYQTLVDTRRLLSFGQLNESLFNIDKLRPKANPTADRHQYWVYNSQGQKRFQVDGAGAVTEWAYNAYGKVVSEKRYEAALNSDVLAEPLTEANILAKLGDYTPIVVDNSTTTHWPASEHSDAQYHLGALTQTTKTVTSGANIKATSQASTRNAKPWPDYVTEIKQQNHPDINGTILLNYLTPEERAQVKYIRADLYNLQTRHSTLSRTFPDKFDDYQGQLVLPAISGNGRFRATVIVELNDGTTIVKPTFVLEKGRQQVLSQTLRWPADDMAELSGAEHTLKYRIVDRVGPDLESGTPFTEKSIAVVDGFYQVELTDLIPNTSYEIVIDQQAGGQRTGDVSRYHKTARFQWVPQTSHQPLNVRWEQYIIANKPTAGASLTGVIAGDEASKIDYIQVYVDNAQTNEQVSEAITYPRGYRFYQGNINLSLDRPLDSGNYRISVHKHYLDGTKQSESFMYTVGDQQDIVVNSQLTIPLDKLPLDVTQPGTTIAYRLAQQDNAEYQFIDLASQRSADGKSIELTLHDLVASRNDLYIKIVKDGYPPIELEGHALVVVDGYSYQTPLLKFADPNGDHIKGRFSHQLYNDNQQLVGSLDAAGYLTEYVYNPAGQKIREIRYAQKAVDYVSQQFDRELADIRPTADVADQQTHFIYDGFGQLTATVNAEGYLSENVYNALGQLTQTIRYHQSVNYAGQSLTELRTLATHANQPNSVESITYDTAGRKQTSTDRFGVVTRYTYNADGLLSQTITGEDKPFSQAQITQRRFDQKGRIIAELTPEGAKRLAEVTTDTAREAVWRDHVTTFVYNEAGLKIRQQAPKTAEGGQPVTFFYYDHQQRLRYSIQQVDNRGQASVIEYRYNSFGEQTSRVDYFTLIDSKELTGGLDNSRQLKVIKSNPKDRITQQDFDQAGRKVHTIAADGAETRLAYNSFGEVSRLAKSIRAANGEYAVTETAYDQRGLVSRISQLVGSAEVSTTLAAGTKILDTHHQYDAFGRLTVKTFADNHRQQTAYDRLNRVIAEINHSGETTAYRYDALGRKVSVTDPLGQVTQYQFDDQNRRITLVSPAGHTVTTQHNQHGETLEITDAKGNRQRFTYDEAGRQINAERLDTQGSLLQQERKVYNQRGWLVESIDSQGIKRQFSYDAVGRKLSETVDPEGAKLTTSYRLDAFGQVTYQRGPDRVSTTMQYDAAGRVLEVMRDSGFGGASLITRSTYNELGQLIAVEKGDRRYGMLAQTHYHYDALGRKVAEVVDPDGLALTTRYQYDARGNVLVKTDANGSQSFFGYDVNNRLRYSVDGQGGVTAYKYDAAGQKILTRHYAKAINVEGLAEQLLVSTESRGDIEARLAARSLPQLTEHDRLSLSFFNADGQVTHKVNGLGQLTALHYDANGNVIQESRYSNPLADTQVYALLENHDLSIVTAGLKDNPAVTTYQFYNALNQPQVVIDAAGYVAVNHYDAFGRLTSTLKYSLHYDDHLNIDPQKMHQLTAADVLQSIEKVKANPEEARALTGQRTQIIYDELGRKQYQIDAAGYISAFKYDVNDRLVASLQYKTPINISLDSVTPNAEQLEAHIAQHNETAVFQQHVYDKVGREVYTIDGQGYVTEKVYDALGQVTGTKRYTMPVEYNAAPSYSSVRRAVRRLDAVATHTAYDNAGRVQLEIDALGHVTTHEYDALGQLHRTVRYAQALAEGLRGGLTSEIAARLSGLSHAQDQATVYRYDAAGHKTALITGAASAVTLGLSEDQLQAGLASGQLRAERYEYDALGQRTVLRQATAEGDFRTLFYYDSKGQLTRELKQVNAEQGYLTVFDYDAFGNKIFENRYSGLLPMALGANQSRSLVYADRIVRFRYDALNRLVAETVPSADGNGHETQYQYDAFGNLTLKTEAAGMQAERRTAYRYDERNQKIAEITALGTEAAAETQYRYDALGRVSAIVDARGVALVQDDSDWALAERARLGIVNTITTADGQTQPGGAKRAHELTEEDIATLQAAYTSEQTFDAAGRKIAERDPLGHETHTVYDAFGNIIKATDPRGQVGYFFYDANNRLRLQIDPKGYATETRYDAFGQVVSTYQYQQALDLSGGAITEQSDLTALISQLQAPMGSGSDKVIIQQHTLNAFGQILSTTQAGVTTTFSYDAQGNKITATDGNGHTTHYAYDAQGRLIEETSPEVRVVTDVEQGLVSTQVVVTRHQYDQLGNKTQTIVGANSDQPRVTEFRYNAQGQLIQQRQSAHVVEGQPRPQVASVNRQYDAVGNLIRETDANGQVTTLYYNARNQLIAQVDGDGVLKTFGYDAAGNRLSERTYDQRLATQTLMLHTPPEGQGEYRETHFEYDANNRELARYSREVLMHDIDQGYFYGRVGHTQVYDANGNVIKTTDSRGHSTYTFYDAKGQAILLVDASGYATQRQYDAAGHIVEELKYAQALPDSARNNLSIDSDPHALLAALDASHADNRITRNQYDALGRLVLTRQVGVSHQVKGTDATGNTVWQTQQGDAITEMFYDANGNNVAIIRRNSGNQAERIDLQYDALNRKILEQGAEYTAANGNTVRQTTSTYYTAQGDTALSVKEAADGQQTTFNLGAQDLITRQVYDNAGHMIKQIEANGAVTELFYDAKGQVVRKRQHLQQADGSQQAVEVRFGYDSQGREIWRDEGVGAIQRTHYNSHGEISGKGINDQVHEYYEYNAAGQLFKTNKKNGAPQVFVYDANGNASLEIQSMTIDLKAVTLNQLRLLDAKQLHITLSRYDARNLLIDVVQPEMTFLTKASSSSAGTEVIDATPYTFGEAKMTGGEKFDFNFLLFARAAGKHWPRCYFRQDAVEITWSDIGEYDGDLLIEWDSGYRWDTKGSFVVKASQGRHTINMWGKDNTTSVWYLKNMGFKYQVKISKKNEAGDWVPLTEQTGRYRWSGFAPRWKHDTLVRWERNHVEMPKLLTLKEQPRQATRLRMYYRPAQEPGYTSRAYDEANYQPGKYSHSIEGARMNREGDWALDLTNAPGLSANQAYEYYYEALTPEGTVINRGEGIFRTTQNAKHGETFDLRFGLQQQAATAAANGQAAKPSQQTLNDLQLRWANLGGYQGKLKFDWNAGFGEAKGSEIVDASAGQINLQPNVSLENAEGRTFTYTVNVYKQNAQGQWELLDWLQGDYSFAAERGESGEFSAKAHHQLSRFHALDQGSVTHRNTGRPAYTKASLDYVIGDGLETSHSIHRTQRFNAFGEVIEEVDGLGNSTTFRYNQLGQMVTKQAPETEATDEQGQVHKVRPTTHYGYDLLGQQITTTDANGNINEQQWAAGQIVAERHADGGQVQMGFDAFGRKVSQTNELGEVTQYHYDRAGNVTRVERAGGNTDQYTYDAAGQRLTHTNALGHTERYQYDSKGRIIAHHSYGNMVTQYSYRYEASIGGIGGWVVTKTDGNKHTLVDHRDAFDRIHYHKDLGDRTFTYGYNASGKLAWQKGDTVLKNTSKVDQEIYYGYYNNGYIKNIDDVGANNYAEFKYDKNGNLIFEGYSNKDAKDGYKNVYTQHSTVEYDSLNRIKKIVDAKYTIAYQYDAMGNRRRVHSRYQQVNGDWHNQDFWYTYDAMNRFTTTMGTLKDGQITPGDHGYRISYNLAGQRVTATNKQHTERYHYDGNGKLTETYIDDKLRAKRINDAVGNTTHYMEYFDPTQTEGDQPKVYRQVNKVYDQDNRATRETTSIAEGKAQNKGSTYHFDGAGNLSWTQTFGGDGPAVRTSYTYERWDDYKQKTIKNEGITGEEFDFPWRPGMSILTYDVNGHVSMAEDKYNARILRYVNNHKGQILTRTEEGHDRNANHEAYLRTHHFYYVNGIGVGDVGDDGPTYTDYATQLAYNQGLMRKPDKTEPVFSADFDANFQAIGENYPAQSPGGYTVQQGDTLQTIALALWGDSSLWFMLADANGLQPQQLKDLKPGTFLTVPNKVTNIHNNSSTFRPYNAGVAIGDVSPTLPDMPPPPIKPAGGGCGGAATIVIAVVAIAATIFTAGAAGAAMAAAGSAAATAGATTLGTMSLGASVLAGSAGIGFAATATAAFAGGVVGSLAGQMAGVAMGVQDGISFKQALKSGVTTAISAGVGHGLGQLAKASPAVANIIGTSKGVSNWQAVARAGISNLAVQGVQQAIGYQKKFDWRSTAASVISTGISRNINGQSELNQDSGQWEIAQEEATRAATSALVEEAVASKIYGRKFEFANVASSAITGAIKGHFSTNWQFMEQRQGNSRIHQEQAVKHKQASLAKSNVGVIEEQKGSLERENVVKITQKAQQKAKIARGVTSDEAGHSPYALNENFEFGGLALDGLNAANENTTSYFTSAASDELYSLDIAAMSSGSEEFTLPERYTVADGEALPAIRQRYNELLEKWEIHRTLGNDYYAAEYAEQALAMRAVDQLVFKWIKSNADTSITKNAENLAKDGVFYNSNLKERVGILLGKTIVDVAEGVEGLLMLPSAVQALPEAAKQAYTVYEQYKDEFDVIFSDYRVGKALEDTVVGSWNNLSTVEKTTAVIGVLTGPVSKAGKVNKLISGFQNYTKKIKASFKERLKLKYSGELLGAATGPIIPGGRWIKNVEVGGKVRTPDEGLAFLNESDLFSHPEIEYWLEKDDIIFTFIDEDNINLPYDENGIDKVAASYYHRPPPEKGYSQPDVELVKMQNNNGQFVVRFNKRILESDMELLHTYAHELFEISRIKDKFEEMNGRMSASLFNKLTKYDNGKSFHEKAHDFANSILLGFDPETNKLSY